MSEFIYTRCPGCSTVFRVTAAQLESREGQVRCGHCRAVFDANAERVSLDAAPPTDPFDVPSEPPASETAARERASDAKLEDDRVATLEAAGIPGAPAGAREEPAVGDAVGEASAVGDAVGDAHAVEDTPSEANAVEHIAVAEPARESPPDSELASEGSPDAELAGDLPAASEVDSEGSADAALAGEGPADEELVSERRAVADTASEGPGVEDATGEGPADEDAAPAGSANEEPTGEGASEGTLETAGALAETPATLPPSQIARGSPAGRFEWKKRPRASAPSTRVYATAAGVLLIGLVLQGVLEYRDTLAAHFPASRPLLRAACGLFGCAIEPMRDAAALSIDASDLQADPAHRGLLLLSATLRNRSTHPIAFPYLELTLTDASDRIVARRAFPPADYAGSAADPLRGIPSNGEHIVRLFLDASATQQAGYRLYLFYP